MPFNNAWNNECHEEEININIKLMKVYEKEY